ncbi:hypothetical protein ACRB8A_20185 (plasmid) [Arthrobacter sp. G.S.26]|uniref:hypothetical protein n=1 Tax=Arthrobacter sp. G.S.26 TaxID=3433706 RepID=UPI003D77919F
MTDHLLGAGLPAGTRGVVTGRNGNRLNVEFDTGFGTASAIVPVAKCALVRKGGGKDVFIRRAGTVATIRIALSLFLTWPLLQFAGLYWWEMRSFDGIVEAFTLAGFESLGDWLLTAIHDPLPALTYALFIAVLSRFAFKR